MNVRSVTLLIGIALFIGAFPITADEPKSSFDEKQLRALLEEIRKKKDLPMMAAAIVNDKGMQLAGAVGVRKRESGVKATVNDQIHLGSDTKPITAWLIAWLIQNGLLGWDATLDQIFPDLAKNWPKTHRKISVTQLLTHHSGLPANYPGGWWSIPVKGKPRQQREAMMTGFGKIKLAEKPGKKFIYSNLGYTVLGAVAERSGKTSWEELLEKQVFRPLKMKDVGHGPMGKPGPIMQPWQHNAKGDPIEPKWNADNPPVLGPAGRLHCPMASWSKFVADVLRGASGRKGLLKPDTYKMMFQTPYSDVFYCRGGWGGQGKNEAGEGLLLAHDGSNSMNYCTAMLIPDANVAVMVATNQGGKSAQEACTVARNLLIKKWIKR